MSVRTPALQRLMVLTIAAILATGARFLDMGGGTGWSSTPNFGRRHLRHPHHHPYIPNGKWVMKYHRSRH